jgi:hypothetical protein
MTDTLATVASPSTHADPGELGPSAAPAAAPAPAAAAKPPAPDAPRGTYEQRRHAQEQAAAGDAPPPSADQQQPPPAAQGEKVKIGKYEVSEAELGAMMDRQAQDDLRAATRPASPEAYEAKLPADLKLPGGVEYKFDVNDPTMKAAQAMAHAKGWSQQDFSDALAIYASHHAQQELILAERSAAEVAKAGVNAPQRVDAVGRFITAEMGEADAKPIRATIVTDAHLRFYEKMMQKISSQGAASFSQSHRAAPETGGIPGYDKMSFEQRRQAQDQNAARRR